MAGEVLIPETVVAECLNSPKLPGAAAIKKALSEELLIRRRSPETALYRELAEELGPGECAAIALAHELAVPVLLDDKTARKIADRRGVKVIGTGEC